MKRIFKLLIILFGILLMAMPVEAGSQGGGPGKGKRHKTVQTYHPQGGVTNLRPFWARKKAPHAKSGKNMPSTTKR